MVFGESQNPPADLTLERFKGSDIGVSDDPIFTTIQEDRTTHDSKMAFPEKGFSFPLKIPKVPNTKKAHLAMAMPSWMDLVEASSECC